MAGTKESSGRLNPHQAACVKDLVETFVGGTSSALRPMASREPVLSTLRRWEAPIQGLGKINGLSDESLPIWRAAFTRAKEINGAVANIAQGLEDSKDVLNPRRNALHEMKSTVDYANVLKSMDKYKENPTHNVEIQDVKKQIFKKMEKFLQENPEQVQEMLKVLTGIEGNTRETISAVQSDMERLASENRRLREQNAQYAASIEKCTQLQSEQAERFKALDVKVGEMRKDMVRVRQECEFLQTHRVEAERVPMLETVFQKLFEEPCKSYGFGTRILEDAWTVTADFREALGRGNVQTCAQNYHEIHDFVAKDSPVADSWYRSCELAGNSSMIGKPLGSSWEKAMLLFGRVSTIKYKVSIAEVLDVGDSLRSVEPDSIWLTMIFLFGFVVRRINMLTSGENTPSIASALILLRTIELLASHVTGRDALKFVLSKFSETVSLHPMGEPTILTLTVLVKAKLWNEAPVKVLDMQRLIQKPFAEAGDYLIMKQTDCLLMFKKSTDQMALIRPRFFSLNKDISEGWQICFKDAPVVGSWTTPFWEIDQFEMVYEVFEDMFDEISASGSCRECQFDAFLVERPAV